MPGIMDMFRTTPAPAPVAANTPAAPSPSPTPNAPAPSPSPNAPAPAPVDPMAAYAKMWDTPSEEGKAPAYNIDPKVMDQVVSAQDFTQGLDPAVMAKIQAGDIGAITELVKHVGQQAYRASLTHQAALTGRFIEAREGYNEKNVNTRVRGELIHQNMADTPNYRNPVVRQQLTETAERLQRQNPDAAPAEIAQMTKDYFKNLVSAMSPQTATTTPAQNDEQKWDKFFAEPDEQ